MGEGEQPAGDPVQDGPDPRLGWFERRINAGLPKVKPDKLDKFIERKENSRTKMIATRDLKTILKAVKLNATKMILGNVKILALECILVKFIIYMHRS